MKESYGKDLASHPDPESCDGGRQGAGEALTGAHAGQPLSCEIRALRGADAVNRGGRPHRGRRQRQAVFGPRAVEDPAHAWKLSARETGDPSGTHRASLDGSAGKGQGPYLWRARLGEVGRPRSTGEAAEQRRARVACGGGGGKAVDQGEHDGGARVPDSEPDRRAALSPPCAVSRDHRDTAMTRGRSGMR